MHDAFLVRRLERLGDLPRDDQRLLDRQAPFCDTFGQRRPFDQFHHQREGPARRFQAMDVRDVWMVQHRQDFSFTPESGEPLHISGQRSRQHLDGDLALQVGVGGAIDLSHAACADGGQDLIRAEARARGQRQGRQVGLMLA